MQVLKDRSRTWAVGQVVENPSLLEMQAVIDKRGASNVVLKNNMNQAVEAEMKIYQKKMGITDAEIEDNNEQPTPSDNTPDVDSIRANIKTLHAKMNPTQRKTFSDKLKADGIPTQLGKIDDVNVLNQMLDIVNSILEE